MAELTNFIYCMNAETVPAPDEVEGAKINALGVMSVLTPEFVPGTYSFSIIFTVLNMDVFRNNTIQIIFSKDGEEKNLDDSGVVTVPPISTPDEDGLPDEYRGLTISMDYRNLIFETEGLYSTDIIFNGQSLGKNHIYVKGKR